MKDLDLKGVMPESWCCVDCGINTAPGFKNRAQAEQAFAVDWNNQGFTQKVNEFTEVYTIKAKVWQAAGMDPMGGCLCIGCREADRTAAGGQGLRTQAPVQFAARHRSVAVAPRCVMTALVALIVAAFGGLFWAGRRGAYYYSAPIIYDNDLQASDSDGVDCDDSCDANYDDCSSESYDSYDTSSEDRRDD
jgi:hypothetical protein